MAVYNLAAAHPNDGFKFAVELTENLVRYIDVHEPGDAYCYDLDWGASDWLKANTRGTWKLSEIRKSQAEITAAWGHGGLYRKVVLFAEERDALLFYLFTE